MLYGISHKIVSGEHYSHHVSPPLAQNYTMLSYKKIPLKYFISHVDPLYHAVFFIKIILDVLILCLLTAKYSCSGFLELCIFWQCLEVKVSKIQNEFMRSSFLPNLQEFLPYQTNKDCSSFCGDFLVRVGSFFWL